MRGSRRARLLPVVCAIALAASTATADAPRDGGPYPPSSPRTSSLGWVRLPGAEACIGPRALALAVEQRLGRPVFVSPAQAEALIEARIEPAPPGFRAHITLTNAGGEVLGTRELDAVDGDCRALDEKLALVMAILLDPEAALAPRAAPPPAPPPQAAPRVPVPLPAPAPRPQWRESLFVGPAVAAGILPRAGLGLSLRGEIEPPSFVPIELGAVVWLDARADASTGPARGANLSLAYGMVGICPLVWGPGATRVRGCVDMEVGAIRAVGYGFAETLGAGQEQAVVQAQAAGRVTRRLWGPLELGVGLGLAVPFNRARIVYLDAARSEQELFRMAPIAAVVEAALGLAFP